MRIIAQACAKPIGLKKSSSSYAGIPIPLILPNNTVRVTIRQSDSEAIVSEAATTSLKRGDATAAAGVAKPAAPEDRVMGQNP